MMGRQSSPMSLQQLRHRADCLRAVPLEAVLRCWGATRDRADKAKWHTERGVISVTGAKFMNWNRSVGGGGAIDLAMHLGDLHFPEALQWLSKNFPTCDAADPAPLSPRPLRLPPGDPTKLPEIRRYLYDHRRLPVAVVEPLIAGGSIYADARSNAVFLLLGKEKEPIGAEIRGTSCTPWRGMAPGSRKDLGYFSIPVVEPTAIILCESAIDAVSCLALHDRAVCISTAGARPNPLWLGSLVQTGKPVCCGFDADPVGDEMARAMMQTHPTVLRLRPSLKDWNEVLKAIP
jgi:hypothetical protein